ncbi:LysE family translocator [Mesorhizobium sp. B2-3-4]|uniref:LysE family translocator n=1 Tax=Mesorhizobium sp. B2-3-4 TaxID=2589959 RepID=UPI00112EEF44|nr:LysE family translocator [Mesorhizobium sp. B2-3-4]TPM34155.1 LysE family translocator [Mesorhizobium sp. B2-3-4]
MTELWIFIGTLAVAYLLPGPDMLLLLHTGARWGRSHALATSVGLGAARATHVALAGLGLAALLRTAPLAFDIIRVGGAAYLIWLGIGIFRARSLLPNGSEAPSRDLPAPCATAAWQGLLTNLLNPKALLFCSVLLPQFIRPDHGSVGQQFLFLGTILVGIGVVFDVIYALTGSTLGRWIARHALAQRLQRWSFAMLLVGFGARLAFSGRPA